MANELHGIRATFEIAGESYDLLTCSIVERLDEIPRLEARLWKDGGLPKPVELLGGAAVLQLGDVNAFDAGRPFKGMVVEAERRVDTSGRPYVAVVVCPPLWKLTKRTDLRTFQKIAVADIVKEVLDKAGVPHRLETQGSYDEREYVVQYRETDFDFLRRLLSEEGIAFAYDHEAEEVVFFDDPAGIGDAKETPLPYRSEFGFDQTGASVWKVSEVATVVSDKTALREYDFKRPRFNVEGDAESKDDGEHALEVYSFPARSVKEPTVKRWAQVLLDAIQCRRDVVSGAASSWSLAPGLKFSIEEHPFEDLNTELLVVGTHLEHEDERSPFRAEAGPARTKLSFEAIPTEKSSYRPERRPRGREVAGIQTGVTTGASGQEVHVDDHGRVNVQFPWDRQGKKDETSSVPMRTIQLPTGGSMFLPRVGWEVVVQHDEGDVDLPLVMGRLYNAEKPPPYALPGGAARSSIQTATTPGGGSTNELRTDDTKGSEEMFFNASKDMTVMVNNNATESVGNNATLDVAANQTVDITNSITVSIGSNQSIDVGGNQKASVETFKVDQCADHTYDIGGNRDMKVGGDHKHTIGASEAVDVGGMKTDLVVGKISEQATGNMTLDVSAARVSLTAADYNAEIGGDHTITAGAAHIVASFASVSSDTTGTSMTKVAGAKVNLVDGDRSETAGASYTAVAAGATIVKADNITFEAEGVLSLVMGASTLTLTPASVSIAGISLKLDGATAETSALILDN